MSFFNVNGMEIHYEIKGTGPKILFIHGIGADLKNPISLFDSPLSKLFTILAFDPRGLGESDSSILPDSIAEMADDAAGLAIALGWDQYHVFGASMGGMVAQELVLRYPDKVQKLILGVTHAGGKNAPQIQMENLYDLSTAEMLRLSNTRQDEAWMAANPEQVKLAEQNFQMAKEAMQSNPQLLRGYNNQAQAVARHDTFERLGRIVSPTLVFAGHYDGGCPYEFVQAMAQQIPEARFELLESGHGDWFFDPKVWEMIIDFLQTKSL